MTKSLKEPHLQPCPDNFIAYKNECFFHSFIKGDYDTGEMNCAYRGSKMVAIKDRATYQFIKAWAKANKFGDFFLGLNFTTNDTEAPVKYSDGTAFNKSIDFDFDDERDKFGNKDCAYLKKGVTYKPRDCACSDLLEQVCQWNSECHTANYISLYLTFTLGPSCPENFFLYPAEQDGRTCYSNTTGKPTDTVSQILENCKAADNFLQRPAVPTRPELIDLIKPMPRYNI